MGKTLACLKSIRSKCTGTVKHEMQVDSLTDYLAGGACKNRITLVHN